MRVALEQVKKAFGPGAVILGTRTIEAPLGGLVGGGRVEITAAPAQAAAGRPAGPQGLRTWEVPSVSRSAIEPRPQANESGQPRLSSALRPYFDCMVKNEVGEGLALRILNDAAREIGAPDNIRSEALRPAVVAQLEALMPAAGDIALPGGARRCVVFVGPPGAGKTSTVAKLAAHFALRARKRVALLSLDTYRLATHAQLTRYGELIGVGVHAAQTVAAVRTAMEQTAEAELLLIDTPGVGLRDHGRFARLAALLRAARADELHLVLPATWREAAQQRIVERFAKLGSLRLVLTHLDEMLGVGAVLSAAQRLQLELSYLCDGQRVPGDLHRAASRELAEALLDG